MQLTATKTCSSDRIGFPSSLSKKAWWLTAISATFLLTLIVIAYQPVMFNFFTSDDFYIIAWLREAKKNPLILFAGTYAGTPYYRPLLNAFLFVEYLACGTHSCAYRIISLVYETLAALVLALLLAEITSTTKEQKRTFSTILWPLFSVGFFLLYPLHTEPINWFVSTTEVLANLFVLSSLLFYVWWRKKGKNAFAVISCVFTACAFLTKEVTVILPAILVTYELLVNNRSLEEKRKFKNYTASLATVPHWLLLGGYLSIRKLATGNFLGSLSKGGFYFPDNQTMFKAWIQSLKMIVVPISSAAFDRGHIAYFFWILLIIGLAGLTIGCLWKDRYRLFLALFLSSWFFISLVPMHGLLVITPNLLDARYGYLASVPLCAFLMLGLANKTNLKNLDYLRYPIFFSILIFSCFILRMNNMDWVQAGKLTNNLLAEFQRLHKEIPGDPRIYFLNIPVEYHGIAIAGIKCSQSMNHKPFSQRNFDSAIWLLDSDQSLPIGFMQDVLEQKKSGAYFYYLNAQDQHFYPINFPKPQKQSPVKDISMIPINVGSTDKALPIVSNLGTPARISDRKPTFVFSAANTKGLIPWLADVLVFQINIQKPKHMPSTIPIEFSYTNDAQPETPHTDHLLVPVNQSGKQSIVLPVRGLPIWACAGHCHMIKLSFPANYEMEMDNAYATNIKSLIPQIQITGPNYNPQMGELALNPKCPKSTVNYNVSAIKNCAGVVSEIIEPGEYFTALNSCHSDGHSALQIISTHAKGDIKLDYRMFKSSGLYKMRLRPVDKQGEQISFCSDHFMLLVSN